MKGYGSIFKDAFLAWRKDNIQTYGAALAYFAVFSLAPLIVIAVAIAGMVFGEAAAKGQVFGEVSKFMGSGAGKSIESTLNLANHKGAGTLAAILGTLSLLLGASGVFGQLQDSMNRIWGVEGPKGGWLETLRSRFLSVAMVFGSCFLLLISLLISAVISGLLTWLQNSPATGIGLAIADIVVSVAITTVLFAAMFKFLPNTPIAWKDVWQGAFFTSILFVLGKFLMGLYLGRSGVASSYGAAGSIILVLLWTYYAAQILFFGAELTKAFAHAVGSRSAAD